MFSQLGDSLEKTFRNLKGIGRISEKNISETMYQIRLSLLEADVDLEVTKNLIENVQKKALGKDVLKSVKPGEQLVKIFQDELTTLLGTENEALDLNPPAHILLCGLNGAGKTTTAAKLAHRLKKDGRRPALIACDLYRPAAIDQLATLAKQIEVPCYIPKEGEKNVKKVAKEGLKWAKQEGATVLIFDTAGRQEIDNLLLKELKALYDILKPKETLLVADSATGQQAVAVAKTFNETIKLSGIVLTKLDGDARGGAALSMRAVTGCPIKYIGEGEKIDNLSAFHPSRMADRILGMGDIVSMVEQVEEKMDEKSAERAAKRLSSGKFDFNDFLEQTRMIQSLGPLEGLLGMMPGMNKLTKQLPAGALDDKRIKHMEAIVLSMTPKERSRPELIKGSRRQRIAGGSGRPPLEVNQLLKQFGQMKKMMKSKGKMAAMMKQMQSSDDMSGLMAGLGNIKAAKSSGGSKKRRR